MLGPLTNPAGARAQIVGVYDPALVPTIAEVLARLGARRAFVVHGAYGVDELSPAGPNLVCEVVDGAVRERQIDPLDLGIPRCAPEELRGGTPAENAAAIRAIFSGEEQGARRDAILLTAAGAIAAGGHADDLRDGLELARETRRLGSRRRAARGPRRLLRRWVGSATPSPAPASRRWRSSSGARRRPATSGPTRDPRASRQRSSASGAAAVSVLVDERFAGTIDDLRAARAAVGLPLLAKGFFTDRGAPRRGARGRRGRGAAHPPRPRRPGRRPG